MKSHPLIMQPHSVRAMLAGIKTETRRIPTPRNCMFDGGAWPKEFLQHESWKTQLDWKNATIDTGPSPAGNPGPYLHVRCPINMTTHRIYSRIQPGDTIYVKEAYKYFDSIPGGRFNGIRIAYKADGEDRLTGKWKSPMFMPRSAARIVRRVESVGFEFLKDIDGPSACREGIRFDKVYDGPPITGNIWKPTIQAFAKLWDSINAKRGYPWASNPPVMVIKLGKENVK